MKFDVVVGNPPYNPPTEEKRGGSGSGNKIWQKFVEIAFKHSKYDSVVAMVVPTNWRLGNFNKHRQHKQAQELIFERGIQEWHSANHHFPKVGVEIDWWICSKNSKELDTILKEFLLLPKSMDENSLSIYADWLRNIQGNDYYEQNLQLNDYRKFFNLRKSKNKVDDVRIYPHLNSGSQTREGYFEWFDKKTKGFDDAKVIIHRTSGPEPFYDKNGEWGVGSGASGYSVDKDADAQEIIDFFSSKLCKWLASEASTRKGFIFPYELFKRIPKNWRELEEKHFG